MAPMRRGEICAACEDAAFRFVTAMRSLFRPAPFPLPPETTAAARLGWDLAGLVTLADWIGSRQEWFPYTPAPDPAAYFWNHALPRASAAIAAAGLSAAPASAFGGIRRLFPGITLPSPIQAWAETIDLPQGPVLAVIEDVTGSGKTEAALVLAHRLLASGQGHGVFLALPTMATANAMFQRMADAYARLFRAGSHPSLVLAHGRAALDARFAAIIAGEPDEGRSPADPADMPAEAHCAAWLAEDRRRALMAQFGVGTIDQALLAVLPVRHAALRLQGLKGKVLIVDEAHAFDPYVQRELVELLRFHAALGGSVILLSATLTRKVRQALVDAFRSGLGQRLIPLQRADYPLATLAATTTINETPCIVRDGLARTVTVTLIPDRVAMLARILDAWRAGAAVAWVRNTVDDAIAAAEMLRAEGVEPLLFHARFALVDRLAIEDKVLCRFGKDSTAKERNTVLVATQVIEQSLDLDFDLLATDLAPADLLIQRAGRLWRHQHRPTPRAVPGPELLVLSPEPVDDPESEWIRGPQPGTAAVYRDPALLWRTARAVFTAGSITTPDDMRSLVEGAAEGDVPPGLEKEAQQAEGKGQAAAGLARQNTLDFYAGYNRQNGEWEPETRTPTRLEDRPTVTLRLALVRDGAIVPYATADTPARAWSLSEVSVAEHHVSLCPIPPGLEAAAEAARGQWGRWERESPRILLTVLKGDVIAYQVENIERGNIKANLEYRTDRGLIVR
jgi:CRISPR-associated endonuclease/helicase Cas3